MKNYLDFNVRELGSLLLVGLLLFIIIAVVMHFISPILVTMGLVTVPLTLTDTLLVLILIALVVRK